MSQISVFDMTGKKVADTELNDAIFGIEPNKAIMHAMVVNYLANQRQGTQSTLTRTEVRGVVESHGDRREQVTQDRVLSELHSGYTVVLLSVLSQEITAIHLIKRKEDSV